MTLSTSPHAATRKAVAPAWLAALACLVPAPLAAADGATGLDWMAGRWCGSVDGVYNEETWMPPRAGALIGMHRDSRDGKLAGFEFFRIVEDGDALVYWTQPGGAPAIAFRGRAMQDGSVDFFNAGHDFPKRIRYRRIDDDTLSARIDDGSDDGRSKTWTWHRDCAGP